MVNKAIVICDTLIWYDLYHGDEVFDKSKYKYYGSLSNIADFLSSDKMNIEEEVAKLKLAIKTMEENADEIIMVDPTSAGSSNWFQIPIDEKEIEGGKVLYKELLKYAREEVISIYGPTINGLIEAKEKFRVGAIDSKLQLVDLFKSKKFSKEQKHEIIIGNVLRWLSTEWNRMRGTDFSNEELANWNSIEVFVRSYAEFLKTVNPKEPPNKNSMIDLLQLLYISKKESDPILIWTKEKKLLKKIKKAFPMNELKNILYQENRKIYNY